VFNRSNRWSQPCLWQRIFSALVECSGPPLLTVIDSSAVKMHRSATGARKTGAKPGHRPLARLCRTTKVHALVDEEGCPHAFLLTRGHIADIRRNVFARFDGAKVNN
jgi:transposase